MRWDRLISLAGFTATAPPVPPGVQRLPILMYHNISDEIESGHPYFWLNTKPLIFEQQLRFLEENGYEIISLSRAVEIIQSFPDRAARKGRRHRSTEFDPREGRANGDLTKCGGASQYVVLTFDDGYRDFYTRAFPLLEARGYPATVFLPTDYIDQPRTGLRGKQHLSWTAIQELRQKGIDFGSHTCSHPQLHNLTPRRIQDELEQSRRIIREGTGACEGFCYPFQFPQQDPFFLSRFQESLRSAGYQYCLTTKIGTVNTRGDLLALKRIPINSADDRALFKAKLQGNYDWLARAQSIKKRLFG